MKLVCERYRIKYVLRYHCYECSYTTIKNDLEELGEFVANLIAKDNYIEHKVVKEKIYEEPYER